MSNGLLFDEPILTVQPVVAMALGLNEAIALQQINYWMARTNNVRNGRKWVYNSIAEWSKQFPFWSPSTVKRTFASLESAGVLVSDCFNADKLDHSKWYSIDYEKFAEITDPVIAARRADLEKSGDTTIGSNCTNRLGQADPVRQPKMTQSLYRTENTSEITSKGARAALPEWLDPDVWAEWVQHLKEKRIRVTPSSGKKAIERLARYKEQGFPPKAVIDHCIAGNYQGLFPPKSDPTNVSSKHPKSLNDMDYSADLF